MDHKPSTVMRDDRGGFQRCWPCGARRRVARLSSATGVWDKGPVCGPEEPKEDTQPTPDRTQAELTNDLFAQPSPFDKRR